MQDGPVQSSGPTFLQIVLQMIITLLINLPFIAAGAFCVYHAVKRGVIAGRKAELGKKQKRARIEDPAP